MYVVPQKILVTITAEFFATVNVPLPIEQGTSCFKKMEVDKRG